MKYPGSDIEMTNDVEMPANGTLTAAQRREAFEKLPPHAIEAEMAILGGVLMSPDSLPKVREILKDEEPFFRPTCRAVYRAMLECYGREGTLDIVTLNQHLEDSGEIKAAGGLNFLVQLANCVPTDRHCRLYAKLIRDKHLLHRAMIVCSDAVYYLQYDTANWGARIQNAIKELQEIVNELLELNQTSWR